MNSTKVQDEHEQGATSQPGCPLIPHQKPSLVGPLQQGTEGPIKAGVTLESFASPNPTGERENNREQCVCFLVLFVCLWMSTCSHLKCTVFAVYSRIEIPRSPTSCACCACSLFIWASQALRLMSDVVMCMVLGKRHLLFWSATLCCTTALFQRDNHLWHRP